MQDNPSIIIRVPLCEGLNPNTLVKKRDYQNDNLFERCQADSNRCITVLQTASLPLGYGTKVIIILSKTGGRV